MSQQTQSAARSLDDGPSDLSHLLFAGLSDLSLRDYDSLHFRLETLSSYDRTYIHKLWKQIFDLGLREGSQREQRERLRARLTELDREIGMLRPMRLAGIPVRHELTYCKRVYGRLVPELYGDVAALFSAAHDFAKYTEAYTVTTDVLAGEEATAHGAYKRRLQSIVDGTAEELKELREKEPESVPLIQAHARRQLQEIKEEEEKAGLKDRYSKVAQSGDSRQLSTLRNQAEKLRCSLREAVRSQVLPPDASGSSAATLAAAQDQFILASKSSNKSRFWSRLRKEAICKMALIMREATGTEHWEFLQTLLWGFGVDKNYESLRKLHSDKSAT